MSFYQPTTGYGAPPPQAADAPGFRWEDVWRLAAARRSLILRVTIGTVLVSVLIALALPTVYSSSAVVIMDNRKNNVTDISAVLSQLQPDPASLQNQIQILVSRDLADKVITKLKLDKDSEFNPALKNPGLGEVLAEVGGLFNPANWLADQDTPQSTTGARDRIIDNFLKHVSAGPNGLSTAITVSATSRSAAKSAAIANALAQAYVQDQVSTKRNAASGTTEWLNNRVNELAVQLQAQDGAIAIYKARHGLNDTAPGSSLVDQQMAGINTQIVQARSDLAEKEAINDRVQSLLHTGNVADVSQVVSSPLIVQLRTQQAELIRDESDLASKYGPLHPKLQAAEAQKRDLDTKITQEVNRLAGSLSNDVMVARAHLQSLESSLGGAEHQANGQDMARVQLQAMQSNATSTRTQYEAFVTRLRQTQDQGAVDEPESRIISPAPLPLHPAGPRRALVVAASLPVGLLLGLLAALMAERFGYFVPVSEPRRALPRPSTQPAARPAAQPSVRASRPVSAPGPMAAAPLQALVWNGPPVLAEFGETVLLKTGDAVIDQPAGRYAHAMAGLVRRLESDDGAAVLALTSAEPGENKSAISISLVRAAAAMGKKVILLDCDPAQAATRALGAKSDNGLYDVLTAAVPLNKALMKDSRSDAFVLSMPKNPPNMATMFGSSQMSKLIKLLRENCDLVVMDCARAGSNPQAALLARLGDATLLVSRKRAINAPAMARSVNILKGANAAPLGLVLTH